MKPDGEVWAAITFRMSLLHAVLGSHAMGQFGKTRLVMSR